MSEILSRKKGKLSETYLLNFSQILHMVILAGFVPWFIGVEVYGHFAALIALPALFQSAFEAFCVAVLAQHGRRDMLRKPAFQVMLLVSIIFAVSFFLLLDPLKAFLASLMTALLFARSYAFALAIAPGSLTSKIVRSELITLAVYVTIVLIGWVLDVRNEFLPMVMVIVSSLLVAVYLLVVTRGALGAAAASCEARPPSLPWGLTLRIASSRAFEDGALTLSPLLLALYVSPTVAGQFRIFVSGIKAVYKLFPFRYEITERDVLAGRLGFFPLALASAAFTLAFMLLAIGSYLFFYSPEYLWLYALVCAAGAVAASISLYPVTCAINKTVPMIFFSTYMLTAALTVSYGIEGFTLGFILMSYAVLVSSLITIRHYMHNVHAQLAGLPCMACGATDTVLIAPRKELAYRWCRTCGHCTLIPAQGDTTQSFEAAQHQYYSDNSLLLAGDLHVFDDYTLRRRQSILGQYLDPNSKVLEVGPGSGHVCAWLVGQGHAVTAIEQAPTLAQSLEARFPGAVLTGEFETQELAPETFDAYCSFHVIEHVYDPLAHLQKAYAVVKPGGLAFIATPNATSWQQLCFQPLSPNFDSAHLFVFSPRSLRLLCEQAGWKLVALHSLDEASGWARVLSKGIRRLRGEDEEASAGKYASSSSPLIRFAARGFKLFTWPLRVVQAKLGYGNEVLLVLQKPEDGVATGNR